MSKNALVLLYSMLIPSETANFSFFLFHSAETVLFDCVVLYTADFFFFFLTKLYLWERRFLLSLEKLTFVQSSSVVLCFLAENYHVIVLLAGIGLRVVPWTCLFLLLSLIHV